MDFEHVLPFLREGKRIYRLNAPDYGLQIDIDEEKIMESYCIELSDILEDDWVSYEPIEND